MAKIETIRKAIIQLTEEDWSKLAAVCSLLDNIDSQLEDIGLEMDSEEVKWEGFSEGFDTGNQISVLHRIIERLFIEKSNKKN